MPTMSSVVTSHVVFMTTCDATSNGKVGITLQWCHNERDSVSNYQPHECLLNRLFRRRSKKTSKLRVTGLYAGNSPGTGEFPAQMASDAENVSIWWRHHDDNFLFSVSDHPYIMVSFQRDWLKNPSNRLYISTAGSYSKPMSIISMEIWRLMGYHKSHS